MRPFTPFGTASTARALLVSALFFPLFSLAGQDAPRAPTAPITFDVQIVRASLERPKYKLPPRAPTYRPPVAKLLRADFRSRVAASGAAVH